MIKINHEDEGFGPFLKWTVEVNGIVVWQDSGYTPHMFQDEWSMFLDEIRSSESGDQVLFPELHPARAIVPLVAELQYFEPDNQWNLCLFYPKEDLYRGTLFAKDQHQKIYDLLVKEFGEEIHSDFASTWQDVCRARVEAVHLMEPVLVDMEDFLSEASARNQDLLAMLKK